MVKEIEGIEEEGNLLAMLVLLLAIVAFLAFLLPSNKSFVAGVVQENGKSNFILLGITAFLLFALLTILLVAIRRGMQGKSRDVEQELREYIEKCLARGMSKHQIMKNLLDAGWSKEKIYDMLK
jgi:uncharacterized membrane protein YqjE